MFLDASKRKKGHVVRPQVHTEEEIIKSLKNMIQFIMQEGIEKASTIDAKAEEEYNILKGDTIQKERLKLNAEYDIKERKLKIKMFTQNSVFINSSRLRIIRAKQEHLDDLKRETCQQLVKDLGCKAKYGSILSLLIIEGLYKLMENLVFIKCREKDVPIIEKLIPSCEETYEKNTTKKITLKVNTKSYLSAESLGGVLLSIKGNKIVVTNTIDSRVEQIILSCTPIINRCLFGLENRNTKLEDLAKTEIL